MESSSRVSRLESLCLESSDDGVGARDGDLGGVGLDTDVLDDEVVEDERVAGGAHAETDADEVGEAEEGGVAEVVEGGEGSFVGGEGWGEGLGCAAGEEFAEVEDSLGLCQLTSVFE